MRTLRRTMCAALAALAMAGCAGNQAGSGGGENGGEFLRVTVENDGAIPTQVRIYLVPDAGQEAQVGTMSTLGTQTLTTRLPSIMGNYRLRAVGGTSYTLTSPRISLRGNESITWNMRRNVVQLGNR